LGSDGATWLLGALAALEFLADKIPVVDHTLHVLHFATKPIAAAVLVGSAVSGSGSPDAVSGVMMGLGALNALGVHTGITAVRGASTAMTLGTANPFVSLGEDIAAIFAAVLAILVPVAGAILAAAFTFVLFIVARHVYLALRRARSAAPA
jgi:hypothetical protein